MAKVAILVVEDEGIVARDLASRLEQLGYAVPGIAASGREAIRKALETLPNLVLMDVVLKGDMDGIETAGQIRESLNVPVIYLTAYSDEHTLQRAKITEPFGYILKPFDERELYTTIEMALYKHRTEEELRRHRDQLEEMVEARTAELTKVNEELRQEVAERRRVEEELAQYADELERSNQELQQFAYVASHDLQEPLRMMTSYLQLLERRYKDRLDSDADEFIGYVVDGAHRMQRLLRDLLAYSRVGTRGKPFEPVACEEVLEQTLVNLKVAIEESDAKVTCDELPTVMADSTQLGQVFQNLIANAIKFREEDPPRVRISAIKSDEEWLFSVCDNGIGIDPQYTDRIFRVFQRLHTREEYAGTGIGLAICRRIVERHGGRIWVVSGLGRGSTFCFTLPEGDLSEEMVRVSIDDDTELRYRRDDVGHSGLQREYARR